MEDSHYKEIVAFLGSCTDYEAQKRKAYPECIFSSCSNCKEKKNARQALQSDNGGEFEGYVTDLLNERKVEPKGKGTISSWANRYGSKFHNARLLSIGKERGRPSGGW